MPTPGTEVSFELACFEVGDRLYGIDVLQIREIVRWLEVTPLPMAPRLIEGVVDLRGRVVPVVDLSRALGGEPVARSDSARIALLEAEDLVFGLRVDAAVDVLSVHAADVESPPALATQAGYDAVRAVVRRGGNAPVLVLSIEHLLESVYRSAPAAEGQG
jgi:purine-binding chemotaxis protein CheW